MNFDEVRNFRENVIKREEMETKETCFKEFSLAYRSALRAISLIPNEDIKAMFNITPLMSYVLVSAIESSDKDTTTVIFFNDIGKRYPISVEMPKPKYEVTLSLTTDEVRFSSSESSALRIAHTWDYGFFSKNIVKLAFDHYLKYYEYRDCFAVSSKAFD